MYTYTVDPKGIPAKLNPGQLEYFICFAILVAGKSAKQTHKKLDEFFERNAIGDGELYGEGMILSPFETIRMLMYFDELDVELRKSKFGQYRRIEKALRAAAIMLGKGTLKLSDLELIVGIGPKTARYIMLYADRNFDGVPLDTHVLKYLGSRGYKVPKSTPPAGERYAELERAFQAEAMALGKSVRELDTEVWNRYNDQVGKS